MNRQEKRIPDRTAAEKPGKASIDLSVPYTRTFPGSRPQEKGAANLLPSNRRSFLLTCAALAASTMRAFAPPNKVDAPTFNPPAGTYPSPQSVTISTTTNGASIRFTTDGSAPHPTYGTLYSGPVNISVTTTLKAIAYKDGMTKSNVTTGVYTISGGAGLYSDIYSDTY